MWRPLASATFFLALVPVIYSYLDQFSRWSGFNRFKGWILVREKGDASGKDSNQSS